MRLSEQVASLQWAKQLKELGCNQESLFLWQQDTRGEWYVHESVCFDWGSEAYPAYTVAELGELMKGVTESYYSTTWGKWACGMRETKDHCPIFFEPTEADARAVMLIYLKSNKLC